MSIQQALFAGYQNLLGCDSADFDGSADFMTTGAGLTGASDGKVGSVNLWCRLDGGDGADMTIIHGATTVGGATSRFRVRRRSTNRFEVIGINAAGTTILDLNTGANTYTASATWLNIQASWDLANTLSNLYINGTDVKTATTVTDDNIDYTVADWAIGGQASGTTLFNGCLAEVYMVLEYIDLSSATNRLKFRSYTGKPMVIGATGSFPTGTAAIIYQHLDDGEAVANFAVNAGTGGDFSITGTLETGSTSPSD